MESIIGGIILKFMHPTSFIVLSKAKTSDYIIAGFLVGFGTLIWGALTPHEVE